MPDIVVAAQNRTETGKTVNRRLRVQGLIPGVLYGSAKKPVPVSVSPKEIGSILRSKTGENTLFDLELDGSRRKVILKEFQLEPIKGTDVSRVTIDAEGVKRAGIQTAPIHQNGQGTVMPHSAVIFDADGETFTYTVPEPRTYVRQKIVINHVDGDSVMLSDGPPAGTEVVTVGAALVYGSEFEVAH